MQRLESSKPSSRDTPNGAPERNGRDYREYRQSEPRDAPRDMPPRRSPPVTPDNPMQNLTLRAALRTPEQGGKKEL